MASLCIGGCCIPYTAIIPLLGLVLKWILTQLARTGLLPPFLTKKLGFVPPSSPSATSSPPPPRPRRTKTSPSLSTVITVRDMDQWKQILVTHPLVIVKFTATWCKPCKQIDPLYVALAREHVGAKFVRVDVDDCDEISTECGVSMMPTFSAFRKGQMVRGGAIVRGADEARLKEMVGLVCEGKVGGT